MPSESLAKAFDFISNFSGILVPLITEALAVSTKLQTIKSKYRLLFFFVISIVISLIFVFFWRTNFLDIQQFLICLGITFIGTLIFYFIDRQKAKNLTNEIKSRDEEIIMLRTDVLVKDAKIEELENEKKRVNETSSRNYRYLFDVDTQFTAIIYSILGSDSSQTKKYIRNALTMNLTLIRSSLHFEKETDCQMSLLVTDGHTHKFKVVANCDIPDNILGALEGNMHWGKKPKGIAGYCARNKVTIHIPDLSVDSSTYSNYWIPLIPGQKKEGMICCVPIISGVGNASSNCLAVVNISSPKPNCIDKEMIEEYVKFYSQKIEALICLHEASGRI